MTPLRAKYIRDLVIRGRSEHTQEAYTRYVCDLARYYRRSPELISYEEVTGWLYHLIKEHQQSASTRILPLTLSRSLRFFCRFLHLLKPGVRVLHEHVLALRHVNFDFLSLIDKACRMLSKRVSV